MPLKRFYRLQRAHLASAPLTLQPALSLRGRLIRLGGRLLLGGALLGLGIWAGWQSASSAQTINQDTQAQRLSQLESELASAVAARRLAEQQMALETSTREALVRELAKSQADASTRLEALTFLESVLTVNDRARPVRLVACELQAQGEGRKYRYRALVAQGINSAAEFNGRLTVGVDYLRRGQRGRVVVGDDKVQAVRVKHFERLEGGIELPADAQPQALDVRILSQDGKQVVAQCQKKMGGV